MATLTPEREAEIRKLASHAADSRAREFLLPTDPAMVARDLLAALDATRAELAEVRGSTSSVLDEARAAVDAAFVDMKAQRAQLHAEHMAQLETLAASVERDARDLALLAEVRAMPRLDETIDTLKTDAESFRYLVGSDAEQGDEAERAQALDLLVRLLRGEAGDHG